MDLSKLTKEELIAYATKQQELLTKGGKKASPIVAGKFEDKGEDRTGKTYKFRDGWSMTLDSGNKKVKSEDLIKSKSEMERLIDMGYHGLEVVGAKDKPGDKPSK